MFPTWRLRLWEARAAWRSGRYDEAAALVLAASLRDFLPAKRLAGDVAQKIVQRAGDHLAGGQSAAGWQDLATVARLGGQAEAVERIRSQYLERVLDEAGRYLLAGQPAPALASLEKLELRGLDNRRVRLVRQVAQLMNQSEHLAARGHFAEAAAEMARAAGLAGPQATGDATMNDIATRLDERHGQLARQSDECQSLTAAMHAALADEDWAAVLSAADALLALAPRHVAAGQARRRAWKAVGMDVTQWYAGPRPGQPVPLAWQPARRDRRSTRGVARSGEVDTVAGNTNPQRALLWIDAVGGFLVCLDDRVVLGQPSPGERLAVPILADLSRRHATIRRDGGAYVLEPLQPTSVDGRQIAAPHVLSDNQLIGLGSSVRLRFEKPHALSATARLTLESHHKTQPSADAILLLADSCVLGPNRHCHVACRDWQHDVVVYRQDGRLYCRADLPLSIDGAPVSGECEIESGMRVEGEEFAFTWENME